MDISPFAGPESGVVDAASGDDLSDEQIEQLIVAAESKLRDQVPQTVANPSHTRRRQSNSTTGFPAPPAQTKHGITCVDRRNLVREQDRKLSNGIRKIEDPVLLRRKKFEEKKATAGADWFNMPRTDLTPQLKRDLQVLRMRNVLDPKRHYKKDNSKAQVPEFSQVGTLVEGPTEFYSARVPVRERKRTLVEQVLAGEQHTGRFKKKYSEIQEKKQSGKRGHYKALMAQRYKKGLKR